MSARKLFLGIDAAAIFPAAVIAELWERSGLDAERRTDKPLHITVQYCGKEITDDTAERVALIWAEQLHEARLSYLADGAITINGPKFDLFGDNNDQLVVVCEVSAEFTRAVEAARAKVVKEVPEVPPSKFAFSAHLTLGEATTLPQPSDHPPMVSSVTFDRITMYGEGDERGIIRIPYLAQ
jgi:2'-5' RNA ligase